MATTVTAIRTALEAVVTGLTPAGTEYGRSTYEVTSEYKDWEERAEADMDREFRIEDIRIGTALEFGISAEVLYETVMQITVGHAQTADKHAGMARRDDDVQQIAQAIHSKANYPSGVQLIIPEDSRSTATRNDRFWTTTITFRLTYTRAT